MSSKLIRQALETALKVVSTGFQTAWENAPFTPSANTPYQRVNLLFAQPDNPEYGTGYRAQGIFQITLMYPLLTGTKDSTDRAELLRETFKRGESFTVNGVTVVIDRTPEIVAGSRDNDRWMVAVKIRWHADIFN